LDYNSQPSLAIVKNRKQLNHIINKIPKNDSGSYVYINLSSENSKYLSLLETKGFREVTKSELKLDNRSKFLQEYVDLIGKLNIINNNNSTGLYSFNKRIWYSSYIPAKNRFTSDLPFILDQYIYSASVLKNKKFNYLIIISPHWSLIHQLKNIAKIMDINFICFEKHYRLWIHLKIERFRKLISLLFEMLTMVNRIFLCRVKLKNIVKRKIDCQNNHYIIKTFIYKSSFIENNEYKDAFFGKLTDYLKSRENLILLGHILNNFNYCINKIREQKKYVIIPFEYFISFSDIVKSTKTILFYKVSLNESDDIRFFGHDVSDIINQEIIRTRLGISLYHYMYYISIKKLSKNVITIKRFLYMYENNPWERMCIMALRKYSPDTDIIGYQHTIVSQAMANMFLSGYEEGILPLPDKVFTVGSIPKKIMENYGTYKNGFIEESCGLRFEYLYKNEFTEKNNQGNILLAPEGVYQVKAMINYVIKQLMLHPKFHLTIRMHPLLPFDSIKHNLDYNVDTIKNITISRHKSLLEDLKMADIVIYRGSTVSLEALYMGIPVIHFDDGSFLSEDPLFLSKSLKWTVSKSDKLTDVIESIYNLDNASKIEQLKKARAYIGNYFHPITEKNLQKFLYN